MATGGIHNERCPHSPVETDTSCAGHENELCSYPGQSCLCDERGAVWTCQQNFLKSTLPIEVERTNLAVMNSPGASGLCPLPLE